MSCCSVWWGVLLHGGLVCSPRDRSFGWQAVCSYRSLRLEEGCWAYRMAVLCRECGTWVCFSLLSLPFSSRDFELWYKSG